MPRPPLAAPITCILAASLVLTPLASWGQNLAGANVESAANRELARRMQKEVRGREEMQKGNEAMRKRDYAEAFAHFENACHDITPSEATKESREAAVEGVTEAGIKLAEQRITEGYYASAVEILKKVSEEYNPGSKDALKLLSQIEAPDVFNKTITPGHRAKVEQVKQYAVEAKGFEESGRYDMATKRNEQILAKDKYNIGAQKHLEQIDRRKDDAALAGYDAARGRAIWEVDNEWARPHRRFDTQTVEVRERTTDNRPNTVAITSKLNTIKIPKISFQEATIREAIDFLVKKSKELDPEKIGVNIVLKLDDNGGGGGGISIPPPVEPAGGGIPGLTPTPGAVAEPPALVPSSSPVGRITLTLNDVPLVVAIDYITKNANLKYKVEPYAVSIVPFDANTSEMFTRSWKVRPDIFGRLPTATGATALGGAPVEPPPGGGGGMGGAINPKDALSQAGVTFPNGAVAIYNSSNAKLTVKNTADNLDLIDQLIEGDGGNSVAKQIEIQSKFVEITQNNLKELSFDWLIGQANLPGVKSDNRLFVGGGTSGTAPATNPSDFPFLTGGQPIGQFPITSGNRSGTTAISMNAIDALLFGGSGVTKAAPGIFALAGVNTDPVFQVVMRALDQKKGVDLLSAPRVTTKSGNRAVIEITREFRYPTEFEPPQIPQSFGNNGNNGGGTVIIPGGIGGLLGGGNQNNTFPVTPTTPTAFEIKNTGVTLEVEPTIGPDNYSIDLNLVPQVVEFEGFINYGSPIQTTSTDALGRSVVNVITPNVINQPIFSTRKVSTSVTVNDGATVVLGGLVREDVQKIEDKTPFIGDIPVIGRLFRSNVDQHIKRNLVIFVTARLVNPDGAPVRLDEETEESVDALPLPSIAPPGLPDIAGFKK